MNHPGAGRWCEIGRLVALSAAVWLIGVLHVAAAEPQGEWVATGSPIVGLASGPRLLVLPDGTPLLIGLSAGGVQQYHPDTGAWTASGSLQVRRPGATVTLLASGLVLLAGGADGDSGGFMSSAELYNPATGVATLTGAMHFVRTGHGASLLASGKVLVSGGRDASNQLVGPAEIYDPGTGMWSLTGVLNTARVGHASVLLPEGNVLIAGGSERLDVVEGLASAEIYDPVRGIWIPGSPMDRPRVGPAGVALRDGRILVADAFRRVDSQLYDPATDAWAPSVSVSPSVTSDPFGVALVVLQDGRPLLASKECFARSFNCIYNHAVFDLQTERWTPTAFVGALPQGFAMTALPDGRVLFVVGGSPLGSFARLFRPDNTSPRLVVSPLSVDFGQTEAGMAVQQTVSLHNTGGATLTGSATIGAPFSVLSGSPFTLAPGASTTAVVQFTSPGLGQPSGVVQFMSNGNWLPVAVTGRTGVQLSGAITGVLGGRDLALIDVTVELTGASSGTTVLSGGGGYLFFVPPNNTYQVTPTSPGVVFAPSTRVVLVGTQDVSGLNFTAAFSDAVTKFVVFLYHQILSRAPDSSGLAFWTAFLKQHCNQDGFRALTQSFFDSPEFLTSRPLTLFSLVDALYLALLARDPFGDQGGVYWADVLRRRRLAVALQGFISSAEFQSLLPDRTNRQAITAVVTRFYTEILGRPPDVPGLMSWVDYIATTRDVDGTAAAFLTSGEFEVKALTFRDYVGILYRGFLGRDPDQVGLDYWEGVLRSDLLSVINDGFISSPEFQGRIPLVCGS